MKNITFVEVATLGKGHIVGDEALIRNCYRTATIIADGPAETLELDRVNNYIYLLSYY